MRHENIVVRSLTEQDLYAVKAIDAESGNSVAEMLEDHGYAWGAFLNDILAGYCTLGGSEDYDELDGHVLCDVYVLPLYRNRGIAAHLIQEAISQSISNCDCDTKVFLTILDDGLQRFYKKLGFTYTGNGIMVKDCIA